MPKETKDATDRWISHPTAGHEKHGQSVVYSEADGKDIAIVYDGDAHADLIAAAPEMLETLKAWFETKTTEDRCKWTHAAAELIRTAEGRS